MNIKNNNTTTRRISRAASPEPVKIYRGSGDPKSGDDTLGDGDEIF
jgi:hypothetical protein